MKTIEEMRKQINLNKETKAMINDLNRPDYHYFDPKTMEFWNSKIETNLIAGKYFITSEDNYDRSRLMYSVREYKKEKGTIDTIIFQKHDTLTKALKFLEKYIEIEGFEEVEDEND